MSSRAPIAAPRRQASCNTSVTARKITNSSATQQGRDNAADAAVQAATLGLAKNSVVTFDMEAYDSTDAACAAGVLAFLHGWTTGAAAAG